MRVLDCRQTSPPCSELTGHGDGLKLTYREMQADAVAIVEQKFPLGKLRCEMFRKLKVTFELRKQTK
jgi:hypothetical protein